MNYERIYIKFCHPMFKIFSFLLLLLKNMKEMQRVFSESLFYLKLSLSLAQMIYNVTGILVFYLESKMVIQLLFY